MKSSRFLSFIVSTFITASAFLPATFSSFASQPLVDSGIDYTESTETINNPGAGYTSPLWYRCKPGNTPVNSPTGNLVLLLVDIGAFSSGVNGTTDDVGNYTPGIDYDLDETFFTNMRKTFENCRKNGCTIAIRFRYDANGKLNPEPETFDKMVEHIEQIRNDGLLDDYKDIIAYVESGFVGSWGEHWGGKFCSFEDKAKLLDILLDVVPEEIPVTVRTPLTFAKWAGITQEELKDYVPEPGSDASRVGLYNDGYMGSDSDLGTYRDRAGDTQWLRRHSTTSYFGGEFSGNLEFAMQYDTYLPENSIPEMYYTHLSYINSNIYQLYKDYTFGEKYDVENVDNSAYYGETVFKFIRDHIGYRFVLRDSDLSKEVAQGGILTLENNIENTGFANPLMNQKAEIILEKDGNYLKTQVDVNTKEWYSCTTITNEFELKIPGGLETGDWNVFFKLSTGNNTQEEMSFRSVKFANNSTWNPSIGANYLGSFTVTPSENRNQLSDNTFYQINTENKLPVSDGEMFTFNNIAIADGYVSNSSERSEKIEHFDEENNNSIYITNDDKYLYIMAELEHNASAPVYNLSINNANNNKNYWIYYQGNGFIYFNEGSPNGCVKKNNNNTLEFRIPFGELMGIEPGVVLSNINITIQDENDSWKKIARINSGEYIVSDNFNVYSAKRTIYKSENSEVKLSVHASGENLSYQWMLDGVPIENATSADYIASCSKKGVFSVRITNENGTEKTVDICEVTEYSDKQPLKGDVNLDGTVSAADLVLLRKYLLRAETLTYTQGLAANMDQNDSVDCFDDILLRKLLTTK